MLPGNTKNEFAPLLTTPIQHEQIQSIKKYYNADNSSSTLQCVSHIYNKKKEKD